MKNCPLCSETRLKLFYSQKDVNWRLYKRLSDTLDFLLCPTCELIFKDRRVILDLEDQRPRYLEHQNEATMGYENFLMKLWKPLAKTTTAGQHGLDFGCGPTKVLSNLVVESGVTCDFYDPLFWPDPNLLSKKYDFVFCSEVVEHFIEVNSSWMQLRQLLKAGACLGIMTSFYPKDFSTWYYHRDPTHVSFYSPKTFLWIAKAMKFDLLHCLENIVIMKADSN